MEKNPFFNPYSKPFKRKLIYFLKFKDVKRGAQVFSEGSSVEDFYFITKGEFEVTMKYEIPMNAFKYNFEFNYKSLSME